MELTSRNELSSIRTSKLIFLRHPKDSRKIYYQRVIEQGGNLDKNRNDRIVRIVHLQYAPGIRNWCHYILENQSLKSLAALYQICMHTIQNRQGLRYDNEGLCRVSLLKVKTVDPLRIGLWNGFAYHFNRL